MVPMLAMEREWALYMVPGFNGYNARCFVYERHLVESRIPQLRDRLAWALAKLPILAGRWCGDSVALTNEGVRFTVTTSRRPRELIKLGALSDYPASRDVASGRGPLATVKVTIFETEVVVSFAASHSVCDGATAWQFIRCWAGDGSPFSNDRSVLPTIVDFAGTFAACVGEDAPSSKSPSLTLVKYGVAPIAERLWRWAHIPMMGRQVAVPFSKDDVARLKAAAPGCSTQVVVAALVVRALSTIVDGDGAKNAKLQFVYDARPLLGLDPRLALVCGFVDVAVYLADIASIPSLALEIRDQIDQCKLNATSLFALNTAAFDRGLGFETALRLRDGNVPSGLDNVHIEIAFNYQARNPLPPLFGDDVVPTSCLCENPFCILPARDGGIALHLAPDIMRPRLSSPQLIQAALASIRRFKD